LISRLEDYFVPRSQEFFLPHVFAVIGAIYFKLQSLKGLQHISVCLYNSRRRKANMDTRVLAYSKDWQYKSEYVTAQRARESSGSERKERAWRARDIEDGGKPLKSRSWTRGFDSFESTLLIDPPPLQRLGSKKDM
jgi:hypothetical protein